MLVTLFYGFNKLFSFAFIDDRRSWVLRPYLMRCFNQPVVLTGIIFVEEGEFKLKNLVVGMTAYYSYVIIYKRIYTLKCSIRLKRMKSLVSKKKFGILILRNIGKIEIFHIP